MSAVNRASHALEVHKSAAIHSEQPATKIIDSVKQSGELTIEAWVRSSKQDQQGPARVITLSKNTVERNFTLGQENATFDIRFRTNSTDANGLPSAATPKNTAVKKLTHVVYTRNRVGPSSRLPERQASGTPRRERFVIELAKRLSACIGQRADRRTTVAGDFSPGCNLLACPQCR